jgi:hypothetical protein
MVKIVETLQAEALLIKNTYRKNGFWYLFRKGFKYILQWPIKWGKVTEQQLLGDAVDRSILFHRH